VFVKGHWLGVSSSETLSNPCVVKALSVTESKIADETADDTAEEEAREGEHDVGVEGDGVEAGLGAEVPPTEGRASEDWAKESVTSEDLQVGRIAKTNVEEVGVVLDEIDRSNSQRQLVISLLDSMRICVLVTMVVAIVTHIY
jgi:hypothetical protein